MAPTNLLVLILRRRLARRLESPVARAAATALDGEVVVRAGAMAATLRFAGGQPEVRLGESDRPSARVEGSLPALVQALVAPASDLALLWARGALRASGEWRLLLRALWLLRGSP